MTNRKSVPTLFLRDRVLLPKCTTDLFVGRDISIAAINATNRKSKLIYMPLQHQPAADEPTPEEVYDLGMLAHILETQQLPDGTYKIRVSVSSLAEKSNCTFNGSFWQSDVKQIASQLPHRSSLERAKSSMLVAVERHSTAFRVAVTAQLNRNPSKSPAARELAAFLDKKSTKETFSTILLPDTLLHPNISAQYNFDTYIDTWKTVRPARPRRPATDDSPVQQAIDVVLKKNAVFRLPIQISDSLKSKGPHGLPNFIDEVIRQASLSNAEKQSLLARIQVNEIAIELASIVELEARRLEATTHGGEESTPQVFISHLGLDKHRIKPILLGLLGAGYRIFIDKPDELDLADHPNVSGIKSGPFRSEISKALCSRSA